MQAVLLVAGKSTRTYPLTLTRPKPLLPIANKPLIIHSLDQMVGLFDEIILIVGYRADMIKNVLGNGYRGIKLIYQRQKEQLGTGHAILQARPFINDKFVAMNGDDLFAREDLEKLVQLNFGALVKRIKDPSLYGVYQVNENNRVLNLVEKPKKYLGDLANIGCYVFEPEIFDEIENTPLSERGEIEITSSILALAQKKDCFVVPISGFWLPTGFAWDLLKHQEFLMAEFVKSEIQGQVDKGAVLHDSVSIGKGSIVKSGVVIEGPVVIGENCTIGPNCYIRKYSSIGNNCRIGQAVEIKNSIIMDHCFISHLSYVGDSVVGEACNLGAGTITANHRHDGGNIQSMVKGKLVNTERNKFGAIFSDGVSTGIHTSIYPGRKLWPGMTTTPGDVIKKDLLAEKFIWK